MTAPSMPFAIFAAIALAFIAPAASARKLSPQLSKCVLTADDLLANARLTFQQFDQDGITPATARNLGDRQCYASAARATEDFLIHGPILDPMERVVVTWHLGQYLALAGYEREAARVIASTRRPVDPSRADVDWNTYVVGTWAFLVKDRSLLKASQERLSRSAANNAANAGKLAALLRCFDLTYRQAYMGICERPTATTRPLQ